MVKRNSQKIYECFCTRTFVSTAGAVEHAETQHSGNYHVCLKCLHTITENHITKKQKRIPVSHECGELVAVALAKEAASGAKPVNDEPADDFEKKMKGKKGTKRY